MKHALLIAAACLTFACGSATNPASPSSPPAPPATPVTPMRAEGAMQVSPSEIVATCVSTASLCAANVAVTIKETAGLAATVTLITATMRTTLGATASTALYDAAKITTLAGSTRVPAFGSLTIPAAGVTERIGCLWSQANGVGRTGTLTITLALLDDRGNVLTSTAVVPVR